MHACYIHIHIYAHYMHIHIQHRILREYKILLKLGITCCCPGVLQIDSLEISGIQWDLLGKGITS